MRFACSCAEENGQHSVRQYFDKYDPIVSRSAYAEAKKRKESTGSFAYVRSDLIFGERQHAPHEVWTEEAVFTSSGEGNSRSSLRRVRTKNRGPDSGDLQAQIENWGMPPIHDPPDLA
jgi:hypothetical protein